MRDTLIITFRPNSMPDENGLDFMVNTIIDGVNSVTVAQGVYVIRRWNESNEIEEYTYPIDMVAQTFRAEREER